MQREESLHLQVLRDTAEALAASVGPERVLARTVEIVANRLGFDVCSIYLIDPVAGDLFLAATYGLDASAIGSVRMAIGTGLTGFVAEMERPFFVSEASKDPRFMFFPETGEERFQTFGGVPLHRKGELVGVLTVQTEYSYTFHSNDVVLLQTVANQVASIIDVSGLLVSERPETGPRDEAGDAPSAPACLVGIGTSAGIGIGRAIVIGQTSMLLPPPAERFAGVDAERARFGDALERAIERADEKSSSFRKADRPEASAIFAAHAAILRDPSLRRRIEDRIEHRSMSAALAVHEAFGETIRVFEARGDRSLSEKVHDLLDVRMQILAHLGMEIGTSIPEDASCVVMAEFLTPAQTAELDPERVVGIVTEHGSETSHASILARSRGIPAVVSVPGLLSRVRRGDELLLDGSNGFVFVNPDGDTIGQYDERRRIEEEVHTRVAEELLELGGGRLAADGFDLTANLDTESQIQAAHAAGARSVGLLRTEFYYMGQSSWPTEEELEAYFRRFLEAFDGGAVTIRLLDVGGEKRLDYVNWIAEPNPILGFRSIRFLLEHVDVYRSQVRALLRAKRGLSTSVRVMVPMVTAPWEMRAAREIFLEAAAEVGAERVPAFGMMIEVPSVLFELESYVGHSDFFSVGTNDLIQYLLAVDRDNEAVRNYYNPFQPAVLRALRSIVDRLAPTGRPVSVCGEMAGRPLSALALMALGFREFSIQPRALAAIGALTFSVEPGLLDELRRELTTLDSDESVVFVLRCALRLAAPFLLPL